MRITRRTVDDTYMPDSSAGQQARKTSSSTHPEEPPGKKPAPNAPKMSEPSAPAFSSSGSKVKKEDKSTKADGGVSKKTKKENPAHRTPLDTSTDESHYEKQPKGYIIVQMSNRGFRGSAKPFTRKTKKELIELLFSVPLPAS